MTIQETGSSKLQPQLPGAPPPVTTGNSTIELAQALGVALADLVSGKGLKPQISNPDGSVDIDAMNQQIDIENEAIQKDQSTKVTADINQLADALKQAFIVNANPTLKGSDDDLAAKALIEFVVTGKSPSAGAPAAGAAATDQGEAAQHPAFATSVTGTAATAPAGTAAHAYNPFLSGIVSVALVEAMMEFMKSQEVGEKVSSNMWLATKSVVEDLTAATAQNIKDKAKAEAMEHIIQAACSAGAMVAQLGGGYAGLKAESASKAQAANLMGGAGATFFTGVTQNIASAPIDIYKGNLDAAKVFLDMQKDFATTMMQKEKEMGDDYSKNFGDFNDALKAWLSKLSEVGNKLTAH